MECGAIQGPKIAADNENRHEAHRNRRAPNEIRAATPRRPPGAAPAEFAVVADLHLAHRVRTRGSMTE